MYSIQKFNRNIFLITNKNVIEKIKKLLFINENSLYFLSS
jgi:hypothetical protein